MNINEFRLVDATVKSGVLEAVHNAWFRNQAFNDWSKESTKFDKPINECLARGYLDTSPENLLVATPEGIKLMSLYTGIVDNMNASMMLYWKLIAAEIPRHARMILAKVVYRVALVDEIDKFLMHPEHVQDSILEDHQVPKYYVDITRQMFNLIKTTTPDLEEAPAYFTDTVGDLAIASLYWQ